MRPSVLPSVSSRSCASSPRAADNRLARQLWVTEQTVKFHLSNVYRKLGVANRTQASRYAHRADSSRRPVAPEADRFEHGGMRAA